MNGKEKSSGRKKNDTGPVPLLDLSREYKILRKEVYAQIDDCFRSGSWVLGPKLDEFEREVKKYLKAEHAIGVASGTDALLLPLRAFSIIRKKKEFFTEQDEIITTPFTFLATAEAIARSGARPVFVDIDPETAMLDPEKVKQAVTRRTAGILPVHLFGNGCEMDGISGIAGKNGLFILEDTAQAFGAEYKNRKLGVIGDSGAFSFFPSKNLGGYGDGGLIVCPCGKTAGLIRILRDHGQCRKYQAEYLGYNSRLDSIQAAVLLAKLKHVDHFNRLRIKIAEKYSREFEKIGEVRPLAVNQSVSCVYNLYVLKVRRNRDELCEFLNSRGINARSYYTVLLNRMKAFRHSRVEGDLKNAREFTRRMLALPIHPFMKSREVDRVINAVKMFYLRNNL